MIEDEPSSTFKILLILSEIFIPLIIFIGVYYIFKPVFGKDKNKEKKDTQKPEDDPQEKN